MTFIQTWYFCENKERDDRYCCLVRADELKSELMTEGKRIEAVKKYVEEKFGFEFTVVLVGDEDAYCFFLADLGIEGEKDPNDIEQFYIKAYEE